MADHLDPEGLPGLGGVELPAARGTARHQRREGLLERRLGRFVLRLQRLQRDVLVLEAAAGGRFEPANDLVLRQGFRAPEPEE